MPCRRLFHDFFTMAVKELSSIYAAVRHLAMPSRRTSAEPAFLLPRLTLRCASARYTAVATTICARRGANTTTSHHRAPVGAIFRCSARHLHRRRSMKRAKYIRLVRTLTPIPPDFRHYRDFAASIYLALRRRQRAGVLQHMTSSELASWVYSPQ